MKKSFNKEFRDKEILITGGTGSIGLGLIRKLIQYKPRLIRILTNDENSIFEAKNKDWVERHINTNQKQTELSFEICDVRDRERLDMAMRGIDIVFHAAAMKHVDICEDNTFDAIKTNVVGTSNIIETAVKHNIAKFVLISTDKATSPTTTLGASKLLAERLTVNTGLYNKSVKTIFAAVRFGNVIGSRGSVFQIFLEQIRKEKPLTVTDPNMTRFIMSIQDAAELILKATHISKGGEIFILKMPSVRILELAENMLEVCLKSKNIRKNKIKIIKNRIHDRFQEYLVTPEEIYYCHDLGTMFKISRQKNLKRISSNELNSETAKEISKSKLRHIIKEVLEDFS
jgi:UDP-N-acetylglucosamine 4,6-dehydratase/5-epimerase